MRKYLVCLLLAAASAVAATWDVGFNFRATAGYVSDPSPTTAAIMGATPYPTTRTVNGQTVTFGWETLGTGYLARDRSATVDARLAGINCQLNNGSTSTFRVDLPAAGNYTVSLALGDAVGGNPQNNYATVVDGSAAVISINALTSSSTFADATGALLGIAPWLSGAQSVQRSFSSTILRMQLGGRSDAVFSCAVHLRVAAVPVSARTRSAQFLLQ
jgi:hypothetical protein